ncbi:MAG: hypothetical protein JXA20_13145 [Spirochaetes bacterium]|nr:hypothetical protein [Spirochaetota bacterium]
MGERCPGQSQRQWSFRDIYPVECPKCGGEMEFFKDEPSLPCPRCGALVANPKIDKGCFSWCSRADECRSLKG